MGVVRSLLGAACAIAVIAAAQAAPRVPADDAEVLERLPASRSDRSRREVDALRAALARDPRRLEVALRLARLHIERARSDSDPRHLGRAQAALAPWWKEAEPPVAVLVLRATVRQSLHHFPEALADLRAAVRLAPGDPQAWLTLATVQQVTGEAAASRASCARLEPLAAPLVAAACHAAAEGASGRAGEGLRRLDSVPASRVDSPAVRAWAATLRAELAERLGEPARAEAHFREALAWDPSDGYARAAYADFLLDAGRYGEAMRAVGRDARSDGALLRYAIAAAKVDSADAADAARSLAARFAAARERGDRVHLREEARFALEVRGEAAAALALARENWKLQKEPADARIVLEAALAAGDRSAAREVLEWVRRERLEGPRIAALVARLG